MKPFTPALTFVALLVGLPSLNAATFLINGDIEDPVGTVVGTWAYTTTGTSGFGAAGQVVGASGIQLNYPSSGGNNPDVLAVQMSITPLSGYCLDTLVISQSVYENTTGNNGGAAGNPGPIYSVAGYTGGFTSNNGTGPQINAPAISGGNLDWQQSVGQVFNNVDDWSVTLNDAAILGAGYTVDLTSTLNANMFQDWISFDATFVQKSVPEPSRVALLGIALIGMAVRRRR